MNVLSSRMHPTARCYRITVLWCALCAPLAAEQPPVQLDPNGRLAYQQDGQGNRIPDFSYCGYRSGEAPLPSVAPRVTVRPSGGDDTARIQAALDFVASQTADALGLRGAVLLAPGQFLIAGQLHIRASGVVLRGHGAGDGGTTLRATGSDRRHLIEIAPQAASSPHDTPQTASQLRLLDDYVPVPQRKLRLHSTRDLRVGMPIEVVHPSSQAWIDTVDADDLGWRTGTRDVRWQRTITAIDGQQITLDAPLTLALDRSLSPIFVTPLEREELQIVGVEDVALVSDFDANVPADEEHAWIGIWLQSVRDSWVRRVQFRHFAGGAVHVGHRAWRISITDCAAFDPISELGGYRRHTYFTLGQQCLFLRCWSERGRHDFAVGHVAAGPNAFVNCYAKEARAESGPLESCALGVLYDNVRIEGHDLDLKHRWNTPPKTGWSAINCLLWQCQAANVRCEQPPVANNWAMGIWARLAGDGYQSELGEFVKPISLYQQQLRERCGDTRAATVGPFLLRPQGATNPSIAQARTFAEQSQEAPRQLIDLIRANWRIAPPQSAAAPALAEVVDPVAADVPPAAARWEIRQGRLTTNGQLLTGGYYTPLWWRGELPPERAQSMGPAITRFAPGRVGTGLTDDLAQVAQWMSQQNFAAYDHHYGLWYDRRRDDHLMVRRRDGDVVPPFYEQPFARSGIGTAWDGLSRYDLTRWNPWYWQRLRRFAALGERDGFALFHQHYFQHNILEAGAHWADSPWRGANNVNVTDLPEPPPYVGDKRIFLDRAFYDVSSTTRRTLHRGYIRQCLDNFHGQRNVVQLTSGEYSGPLAFVQFWVDTIVEWERENNADVILGLSCPKDVQDAILADPQRSPHIDVIDIRYWTYTEDGTLYAPAGGQHLSPRQHLRQQRPNPASFASIARSVREYRQRFPEKVVTYNAHVHCRAQRDGWAILMGGGSLPNVPTLPLDLRMSLPTMSPSNVIPLNNRQWCLADAADNLLVYSEVQAASELRLPSGTSWEYQTLSRSGQVSERFSVTNGRLPLAAGTQIVWAQRGPHQ